MFKTQQLMHRFAPTMPTGSWLFYAKFEDQDSCFRSVVIDRETYSDMGEPEVVTMTLEVGDTLNG